MKNCQPISLKTLKGWIYLRSLISKLVSKYNCCSKSCVSINYSNLKKACLIDYFPISSIDKPIEAIVGHKNLSFVDIYLSYDKMSIEPSNAKMMTFVIGKDNFDAFKVEEC